MLNWYSKPYRVIYQCIGFLQKRKILKVVFTWWNSNGRTRANQIEQWIQIIMAKLWLAKLNLFLDYDWLFILSCHNLHDLLRVQQYQENRSKLIWIKTPRYLMKRINCKIELVSVECLHENHNRLKMERILGKNIIHINQNTSTSTRER